MIQPSDEDSSKLVLKHLMDVENADPCDSDSKLLLAAVDSVEQNNNLLKKSFLRAVIVASLCLWVVYVSPIVGIILTGLFAILYFIYDYYISKQNNKHVEKLIMLSSDIDEKRHVLKELNRQLHHHNNLLNEKVNIINQYENDKRRET